MLVINACAVVFLQEYYINIIMPYFTFKCPLNSGSKINITYVLSLLSGSK